MTFNSAKIITISGTSSNSGKTTLLCELMRRVSITEQWEAIKLTRGHYRSCGKDPHACCVSDLLGEKPTVRSGRDATFTVGKDTARFWDAGATNVHWVIATDAQVEAGIREALARVQTPNVLIEGTSVLDFVKSDFAILAVGSELSKLKASARRALIERKFDALFLSAESANSAVNETLVAELANLSPAIDRKWLAGLPILRPENLDDLARNLFAQANPLPCFN